MLLQYRFSPCRSCNGEKSVLDVHQSTACISVYVDPGALMNSPSGGRLSKVRLAPVLGGYSHRRSGYQCCSLSTTASSESELMSVDVLGVMCVSQFVVAMLATVLQSRSMGPKEKGSSSSSGNCSVSCSMASYYNLF